MPGRPGRWTRSSSAWWSTRARVVPAAGSVVPARPARRNADRADGGAPGGRLRAHIGLPDPAAFYPCTASWPSPTIPRSSSGLASTARRSSPSPSPATCSARSVTPSPRRTGSRCCATSSASARRCASSVPRDPLSRDRHRRRPGGPLCRATSTPRPSTPTARSRRRARGSTPAPAPARRSTSTGAHGRAAEPRTTCARIVAELGVPVQYGGGFRSAAAVAGAIAAGRDARDPRHRRVQRPRSSRGRRALRGADRRERRHARRLRLDGRLDGDDDAARRRVIAGMQERGVRAFVFTNVAKDGLLGGPASTRSGRWPSVVTGRSSTPAGSGGARTSRASRRCAQAPHRRDRRQGALRAALHGRRGPAGARRRVEAATAQGASARARWIAPCRPAAAGRPQSRGAAAVQQRPGAPTAVSSTCPGRRRPADRRPADPLDRAPGARIAQVRARRRRRAAKLDSWGARRQGSRGEPLSAVGERSWSELSAGGYRQGRRRLCAQPGATSSARLVHLKRVIRADVDAGTGREGNELVDLRAPAIPSSWRRATTPRAPTSSSSSTSRRPATSATPSSSSPAEPPTSASSRSRSAAGSARSPTRRPCSTPAPTRSSVNCAAVAGPALISELGAFRRAVRRARDRRQGDGSAAPGAVGEGKVAGGTISWRSSWPAAARRRAPTPPVGARGVERGAGEILLTSMDRDGTNDGYGLELMGAVAAAVDVPVIASGGAGTLEHLADGAARRRRRRAGGLDFHYGTYRDQRGQGAPGGGRHRRSPV